MATSIVSESLISEQTAVLIIEAPSGPARRRWLEEYARKFEEPGARTFVLSCDFDCGGAWAGVNELFLKLLPDIESSRPGLLDHHALELVHTLPNLRQKLIVRHLTLTDIASAEEKSFRNYAADRAFRNVHGLIDLLDAWKTESDAGTSWTIVCDSYDNAGTMSRCFFHELERRVEDA